jgi:hypothetical protein
VGIGSLGFSVMMNPAGQVLHDETLSTTLGSNPATSANNNIVFLWTPGTGNVVLVRKGDQAAGCAPGVFYGSPTPGQALSPTAVASFIAPLTGAVTTGVDDQGLFVGRAGNLQLAARRGDVAPGTGGFTFGTINFTNASNDSGAVVFYSTLVGPGVTPDSDSSVWTGTPGNLHMIAREGDPAPGIQNGVFAPTGLTAGTLQLNARGDVIITGANVLVNGTTTISAAYGWDEVHGLQLLLAAGDVFTTAAGAQTATTASAIVFPSGDGCTLALNNNGDYFLRAQFTTGSAMLRGHLGSLLATPSSLSATAGGVQTMELDAGAANGTNLYLVAGTTSGTRPGFDLGGQHVPLNLDWWLNLSCTAANSAVYVNTYGVLDLQGRATASFHFPAGYGYFAGLTFHHAFGVIDGSGIVRHVSEPASLLMY